MHAPQYQSLPSEAENVILKADELMCEKRGGGAHRSRLYRATKHNCVSNKLSEGTMRTWQCIKGRMAVFFKLTCHKNLIQLMSTELKIN